jgi:hypothetical protein
MKSHASLFARRAMENQWVWLNDIMGNPQRMIILSSFLAWRYTFFIDRQT